MENTVTKGFRACLEQGLKTACVSQNLIPKRYKVSCIFWFKHILFHLHEKGLGSAQMLYFAYFAQLHILSLNQ